MLIHDSSYSLAFILTLTQDTDVFIVETVAPPKAKMTAVQNGRLVADALNVVDKDDAHTFSKECTVKTNGSLCVCVWGGGGGGK